MKAMLVILLVAGSAVSQREDAKNLECPKSCRCLFTSERDCSVYYQCVDGRPYLYRCSPGLLFNKQTLSCDYSYNVNCSLDNEETTLSTTSVNTTNETQSTAEFSSEDEAKDSTLLPLSTRISKKTSEIAIETTYPTTGAGGASTEITPSYPKYSKLLSTTITEMPHTATFSTTKATTEEIIKSSTATERFTTQLPKLKATTPANMTPITQSSTGQADIFESTTTKPATLSTSQISTEDPSSRRFTTLMPNLTTTQGNETSTQWSTEQTGVSETSTVEASTPSFFKTSAENPTGKSTLQPNSLETTPADETSTTQRSTKQTAISITGTTEQPETLSTSQISTENLNTQRPITQPPNSETTTPADETPKTRSFSWQTDVSETSTTKPRILSTSPILTGNPSSGKSTTQPVFSETTKADDALTRKSTGQKTVSEISITETRIQLTSQRSTKRPSSGKSTTQPVFSETTHADDTLTQRFTVQTGIEPKSHNNTHEDEEIRRSTRQTGVSETSTTEAGIVSTSHLLTENPITMNKNGSSTNHYSSESETTPYTQATSEFECPTRFGLYPDPRSCFKFYQCSHWISYLQQCPSGLHFNPNLTVCDWPSRAGCAINSTEPTLASTAILNATTSELQSTTKFSTNEKGDDYSFFSSIYTTMLTGVTDINHKTTYSDAKTDDASREPIGETTNFTNSTEIIKKSTAIPTKVQTPVTSQTTTKTTKETPSSPVDGSSTTKATKSITHADETSTTMGSTGQTNVSETETSQLTENPITRNINGSSTNHYSSETGATTSSEFECPTRFGLYPDPRSCFRFHQCSHWIPYLQQCPSGLHFNPNLTVCDWPNRAGCVAGSTETTALWSRISNITRNHQGTTDIKTTFIKNTSRTTDALISSKTSPEITNSKITFESIASESFSTKTSKSTPRISTTNLPSTANYLSTTKATSKPDVGEESVSQTPSTEPTQLKTTVEHPSTLKLSTSTKERSTKIPSHPFTGSETASTELSSTENPSDISSQTEKFSTTQSSSKQVTEFQTTARLTDKGSTVQLSTKENSKYTTTKEPGTLSTGVDTTSTKSSSGKYASSTTKFQTSTAVNSSERYSSPANPVARKNVTATDLYTTDNKVPATEKVEFVCPSRFGLFPDPRSCYRFYQCSHWISYLKLCPDGLHFNPKLTVCDWPNQAGCV